MTLRARRQRRSKKRHKSLKISMGVVASVVGIAILSLAGYAISVISKTPPTDQLKPVPKGTSSIAYASDGSFLGYVQSDESRTPVPWDEIPRTLRNATVAIEDEHYYKHSGVDYFAIARAAVENVRAGATVQGGSTLTQQLVRNTLIGKEPTLDRKLREAALAQKLEKKYTKNQILEQYLNSIPYGTIDGQTAIGVEAAAQTYFSKDAKDLTLEDSALLAGLPQAPSVYNPLNNPKKAMQRRNLVLEKMAKLGYIDRASERIARSAPLGLKRGYRYTTVKNPFFFDYVKDRLIEKYGVNTVRKGGLKIHTTINPNFQKLAKNAITSTLNVPGDPSSAIVSIDPANGFIRAMASSQDYSSQKFNLAVQGRRQPGSAFKTMALTEAIRRGVDPESTYYESKKLDILIPGFGNWSVSTYDESYRGRMSLTQATLASDNTVYAQLALDLGPKSVADTAHDLGITSKLEGVPSETLGGLGEGVSPLEMANAYATLAAAGKRCKPASIKQVSFPDGKTEQWGKSKCEQVISDGVAYEVTKILEKNVQGGTGVAADTGCPYAGKTGTTDNHNDAWFVGFSPKLATSVWVGYPNALREMNSVHGIAVAGGTFPAEISGKYLQEAIGGDCVEFPEPTEPIQFVPFFGKYATQGSKSEADPDSLDDNSEEDDRSKEGGRSKGGGFEQKYDEKVYEPGTEDNSGEDKKDSGNSKGKDESTGNKPDATKPQPDQNSGGTPAN